MKSGRDQKGFFKEFEVCKSLVKVRSKKRCLLECYSHCSWNYSIERSENSSSSLSLGEFFLTSSKMNFEKTLLEKLFVFYQVLEALTEKKRKLDQRVHNLSFKRFLQRIFQGEKHKKV